MTKANTIDMGDLQDKLESATKKAQSAYQRLVNAKAAFWRAEDALKAANYNHSIARERLADATRVLVK